MSIMAPFEVMLTVDNRPDLVGKSQLFHLIQNFVEHSLQSSSRPPSSRAFLVGTAKVYSGRCEADVLMSSLTLVCQ